MNEFRQAPIEDLEQIQLLALRLFEQESSRPSKNPVADGRQSVVEAFKSLDIPSEYLDRATAIIADRRIKRSASERGILAARRALRARLLISSFVLCLLMAFGMGVKAIYARYRSSVETVRLVEAAQLNDLDGVQLALKRGAAVNGRCRIDYRNESVSAAEEAVRLHNRRIVRELLKQGANPNTSDEYGEISLLMRASQSGDTEIVTMLLSNGASVNAKSKGESISTPSESWWRGDDVTYKTKRTALMYAAESGCESAVRLLVGQGADVNLMDGEQNTALSLATKRLPAENYSKIVAILRAAGAER